MTAASADLHVGGVGPKMFLDITINSLYVGRIIIQVRSRHLSPPLLQPLRLRLIASFVVHHDGMERVLCRACLHVFHGVFLIMSAVDGHRAVPVRLLPSLIVQLHYL